MYASHVKIVLKIKNCLEKVKETKHKFWTFHLFSKKSWKEWQTTWQWFLNGNLILRMIPTLMKPWNLTSWKAMFWSLWFHLYEWHNALEESILKSKGVWFLFQQTLNHLSRKFFLNLKIWFLFVSNKNWNIQEIIKKR